MISKEKLLTINDLGLLGKIDKMDDKQFAEYCKSLDEFIEKYPVQESGLKNSFEQKDLASFSRMLLVVWDMLTKIYAETLAENCRSLLSEVRTANYETAQASLTNLTTAISMLSIDIQMAQHKDDAPTEAPAEAPAESKPAQTDQSEQAEEETVKKTILAVDDVSLFLNVLRSVLQFTQYKFVGVKSGDDALMFIKSHTPDLFILDVEMPGMNGYELAEKIRERGHTAPIIFLTGNSTKEHVVRAIQAGAADFIIKPINKDHVLDKINKCIG